ncbi:hypothetical protein RHSIM_Rhsim05G0135900 [Rhododendron simsii]|uniref:Retrotransposon gag domain-containing protein n=1 Tax=Rhododendron simsii TaxID=118357 RepID=A0A834H028_RHOSS|nr:hypothetical protein RHSIM_Rhsim05G0135900 [Rhododendron simsii]
MKYQDIPERAQAPLSDRVERMERILEGLLEGNNMTVSEYDKAFTDLSQFAPHMVSTDNLKARRFEEGLKDVLRKPIKMFRLPPYTDVLNVALMSETDNEKLNTSGNEQRRQVGYVPPRNQGGSNPYKKQNTGTYGWSQGSNSGGGNQNRPCGKCGKVHIGQCYEMLERVINVDRWDI